MDRRQSDRPSEQIGFKLTPTAMKNGAEIALRAAAGLLLLYFGVNFASRLHSTMIVDRHTIAQSLFAVVAAITVTVGYAVLAALPLRGTQRVVQNVVSIAALLFVIGFSQRFPSPGGALFMLALLLVCLWMVGISWLVMRIPKLHISQAAVSAVALVLLGQMIPILL